MRFSYEPLTKNLSNPIHSKDVTGWERTALNKQSAKNSRSSTLNPTRELSNNSNTTDDPTERLYTNRSTLKILVSRVAMHMRDEQRRDFFKQIDELLDPEEFTSDDSEVDSDSFLTFLNFHSLNPHTRRIALTITSYANIVASWISSSENLSIEFLPSGISKSVISITKNGQTEIMAHQGNLQSLKEFLNRNEINSWLIKNEINT